MKRGRLPGDCGTSLPLWRVLSRAPEITTEPGKRKEIHVFFLIFSGGSCGGRKEGASLMTMNGISGITYGKGTMGGAPCQK
jgi:hypothetical protein